MAIFLLPQIEYDDRDWTLFNTYRYKKYAKEDAKLITRFKTIILKSMAKRYFLYQEVI